MMKKALRNLNEKDKENLRPIKHLSWGETCIQEFDMSIEIKLEKSIRSGDPLRIFTILQGMNYDVAKELVISDHGSLMRSILRVVNERAQYGKTCDNTALKELIRMFMGFDRIMAKDIFLGIAIHLAMKKSATIHSQVSSCFQEISREFENSRPKAENNTVSSLLPELNTEVKVTNTDSADVSLQDTDLDDQHSAPQEETQTSQRGITANGKNDNDVENTETKNNEKNEYVVAFMENNSSLASPLIVQFYIWIAELPAWLQEQILNSAPVKALIESAEQWSAMHDKKSTADLFAELFTVDLTSDATDATEDNINAKVTIDNSYTIDQIDMSMVLNEAIVSGWILPTATPGLNNFFIGSDSVFNELPINFNGLHEIDLF